ncbi:hypothetical protein GQX74_001869 [Glossina fuscipes]|nr:hypothetical protein GQX74_001869 [Glossina fuscipes]
MEITDFGLSKEYGQLDWSYYPTLDEIYNWLDLIIKKLPKVVTGFNIGTSYEGRLIRGVKLCFKSNQKAIFIESNIHAREWITSAACTYLILELLFSRDPDVRQMANRLDWWIVPVLNVDGFVYSHEKERLWRKSRRYVNPNCMGVDLNRNFEYQWGRIKHDPCSNQYGGSHPLSEPETEHLTKFINSNIAEGTIKIYIALHAAAQAVLLPWCHTKELPPDYKRLMYVAKAFVDAAYVRFCTKYRYGTSANILSMTYSWCCNSNCCNLNFFQGCGEYCGTSKDWAYAVKAIPMAFTIELPGRGRKSPFELPKKAILRVGLELVDGLIGTYASELRRAKDCTADGETITTKQRSTILMRNMFPKKRPTYRVLDWSFYPTLCEIYAWMDSITKECPKVVTGFDIGRSYEGRLIRGLKLSFRPGKKAIFIESNIHAREWITSATCTYLIRELLFSRDPDVRELAESLDWWIIPVFNVDGFAFSHEEYRLWRKSRRPSGEDCIGIDLNRNFSYKWELRKCGDPSSNMYSGPHAESEPEVKQLTNFINNNIPDGSIKVYIALHAAAQAVLIPWAFTKMRPKHYNELLQVADAFADASFRRYHTRYICATMANVLKLVSGTSTDWAHGVKGIPIALCLELPGKGTPRRFELPEEMILRVGAELVDGFIGMIKAVKELGNNGSKTLKPWNLFLDRRSLFSKKRPTYRFLDWTFYPTLCEIYYWMDIMIEEFPGVVTGFDIGRSYEGRLIRGLKLSFGCGKKAIFIESNIHAREWITSNACTYLIMELLFSINPDVRELAESLDWWIIPVLNVDGFVYSHEKERLWRKSRRPASPDYIGIDLNRNFSHKWSAKKCERPASNVYSGPHPESEPEVEQLTNFINNNIPDGSIKIYVALHAPDQAILTPWSYTKVPPKQYNDLLHVANAFVKALYPRYRTKYKCGTMANILSTSSDNLL